MKYPEESKFREVEWRDIRDDSYLREESLRHGSLVEQREFESSFEEEDEKLEDCKRLVPLSAQTLTERMENRLEHLREKRNRLDEQMQRMTEDMS